MDTIEALRKQNELQALEINRLKQSNDSSINKDGKQLDQESQVRFRTIFECSRLANKIIASDFSILEVNQALLDLLGYATKEELIGTKILDYSPLEHHHHWKLLQENLWKQSVPSFNLETCLKKKDGSLIWCNVNSLLFEDNGKVLGYTILENISVKREMRLHKDEFISLASHELKTPVTRLKAVVQVMNRMISSETQIPEKIVGLAQDADRHVVKITHLINDLLNSTKVNENQLLLNKTQFKLQHLLDVCCRPIQLKGTHKISLSGSLDITLSADKDKIGQVITNFLDNSVKYCPDNFEISIEVEDLNEGVKISVSDNGCGISPEDVPYIFDRYYWVNKNENFSSGLGLGLHTSAQIIKSHNGAIGVQSELAQGTTFWFTLPK
jgi:PAS domain S-box-containing protein